MSKRKVTVGLGIFDTQLVKKWWAKINTSGNYGQVALPDDEDCIAVKQDSSVVVEQEDEKAGAKTNGRVDYAAIRQKGKTKATISTHLHMSKNNEKESPLGKFFELIFGKREVISSTRGASTVIDDPFSTIAGITVTTAGALIGMAGNMVTLVLTNGGSSGTASLAKVGNVFTLTYYNDSTVEDVVTVLAAHADLNAVADANGDDTTDLFSDLLATRALASGSVIYLNGGAEKGFLYTNEDAPTKDMTLVVNGDKSGQIIPGFVPDKISIEMGDNLPVVKIEGTGRRSILTGGGTLTIAPSAATKLYTGSEYNQFKFDPTAPSYVDVIDNDRITYKSKANKIVGTGSDGSGAYIQVQNPVTADIGDFVVFHEPENHKVVFQPSNGQSGSVEIDGIVLKEKRNLKFEYGNNHQMFDNLAFTDTVEGFAAAKLVACKLSVDVYFRVELLPLITKLQSSDIAVVPFKVTVGNKAGETMVIFLRNCSVKSPDLQDKADEVTMFTIEGEIVVTPETADQASILVSMC